ncbi:hypothetical protein ACP4OV_026790 [Aristida adscensionis]
MAAARRPGSGAARRRRWPDLPRVLLDSRPPAASCSLRELHFDRVWIYKIPNWMGSFGNLQGLKLMIFCVTPEDFEILRAMPSLVYLKLGTHGGTSGKIVVRGSNGFRSLKYFCLGINCCGTALEFEVRSMPKLEHIKLHFCVHKTDCLNGASNFGILYLSSLSKVEVIIESNCSYSSDYHWETDTDGGIVRDVASTINAPVETLPNHPTV